MTSFRTMTSVAALAVLSAGALGQSRPAAARFITQHAWAGRGTWMKADTHIHTKFSDGSSTVAEVVDKARQYGCDAIAITDHASGIQVPAYEEAIRSVRQSHPELITIAGMEWNPPPYGGREHVGVLMPDVPSEAETLAEFKRRFDDYNRSDGPTPPAADALVWLARAVTPRPVVVYNHPSRKDDASLKNEADMAGWRAASDVIVGFEGAPGHQGHVPYGSYLGKEQPIDRWDPVVARPGDAWDRLLQRGIDVHGAMASSDFHNANPSDLNDFWPCQFAETWYYVPERTVAGLLTAMRAGTFFGVHGHIAQNVQLTVSAPGLPRPAVVGESLSVPSGATVTITAALSIPASDWTGAPNRVDDVEIFLVTKSGVDVRIKKIDGSGDRTVTESAVVRDGDLVVRARGRRVVDDGPDLMFYTNAIRVHVAP